MPEPVFYGLTNGKMQSIAFFQIEQAGSQRWIISVGPQNQSDIKFQVINLVIGQEISLDVKHRA